MRNLTLNNLVIQLLRIFQFKYTLILTATFYTLYTFLPFKNWFRFSNFSSEPFPQINTYQDSTYYLGQIREVLNGNYSLGNPLLFEHSQDGFSYGNSSLFYIWGTIGNVLNLELIQIYLLMIAVNSFFLIIILTQFYRIFLNNNFPIVLSLIVATVFVGPLGRPSPTQQLLPILLLAITIVLGRKTNLLNKVSFTLCAVILVLGNQYYSLLLIIWMFFMKIMLKNVSIFYLSVVFLFNSAYFAWTRLIFDSSDDLIAAQLGIHYSRIPGAIGITAPTAVIIFFLFVLYLNKGRIQYQIKPSTIRGLKIFYTLIFSLLISVNSQIFTGITAEMESHFRIIWEIFLSISVLGLYSIFKSFTSFKPKIYFSIKFIFLSILVFMLVQFHAQFRTIEFENTYRSNVIKQINSDPRINVVVVKNDSQFFDAQDQIIIQTDAYLYWHSGGKFSKISKPEILSRFACIHSGKLTYREFLKAEVPVFDRRTINANMKNEKLKKFLSFLRIKTNEATISNNLINDYILYLKYSEKCKNGVYEFQSDLVID